MKAYLLDTLNRYKRFSENLDVKTTLCNKSWWVFNDCGEKEVYIFEEDGSLIISVSGKVTNATWRYMSANKSLIINANDQSYMLNPAFMDGVIFALQLDGTNECFFMIDEGNASSFKPKTLLELNYYFEKKEQILIAAKKAERARIRQEEIQQRERQAQCDKENAEERFKSEATSQNRLYFICLTLVWLILIITPIAWLIFYCYTDDPYFKGLEGFIMAMSIGALFWLILYFILSFFLNGFANYLVRRYKKGENAL